MNSQGYKYAGWDNGVAQGSSISGNAALDFLAGTAMVGIGRPGRQLHPGAEKFQTAHTAIQLGAQAEELPDIEGSGWARDFWETTTFKS